MTEGWTRGSPDQAAARRALASFCDGDGERSVACEILRGPQFAAGFGADVIRPGASVLKVALVVAVQLAAQEGRLSLGDRVPVADLPATRFPNVVAAFDEGRELTLAELCRLSIVTSDNRAASFLWRLIGGEAVNRALAAMGCRDSTARFSFEDETFAEAGRANETTANDAIQMLRFVYRLEPDDLLADALRNNLRNHSIPLFVDDEIPVAHKTGGLEGVANDAGVIYAPQADVAFAFLTDRQQETAATAIEIGGCVRDVLRALGLEDATK